MSNWILASKSPRRKELLTYLIDDFEIMDSHVDEESIKEEFLERHDDLFGDDRFGGLVEKLSIEKAKAVNEKTGRPTIAGDSIVILDEDILEKPEDREENRAMLEELCGREHKVYSGAAIVSGGRTISLNQMTMVKFYAQDSFQQKLIDDYVESGQGLDKAGGYGIQDKEGAQMVEWIVGDYYTVVGLPLAKLSRALKFFNK